jgi:hypothetical protein
MNYVISHTDRTRNVLDEIRKQIMKKGPQSERDFSVLVRALSEMEGAQNEDGTYAEPHFSVAFLSAVGQRPATTTAILEVLLTNRGEPLYGRQIAKKLASKFERPEEEFTSGNSYQRRVGDAINALQEIGVIVQAKTQHKKGIRGRARYYEINPTCLDNIKRFIRHLDDGLGIFSFSAGVDSGDISEMLQNDFDGRVQKVIHPSGSKESFKASSLIESLMDDKVGLTLYEALEVLEKIKPGLRPQMKTTDIQKLVYAALQETNPKLAKKYLLEYPEEIQVKMADGSFKTLGKSYVNDCIDAALQGHSIQNRWRESLSQSVIKTFQKSEDKSESTLSSITRIQVDAVFDTIGGPTQAAVMALTKAAEEKYRFLKEFREAGAYSAAENQHDGLSERLIRALLLLLGYAPLHNIYGNAALLFELTKKRLPLIGEAFGVDPRKLEPIYDLRPIEKEDSMGSRRNKIDTDFASLIKIINAMAKKSGSLGTERIHRIFETEV